MASTLSGTVRAPPSKSYTHRAVVLAALSGGPCRIRNVLRSEDTDATVAGVTSFGAAVTPEGDDLRVSCGSLQVPGTTIDARNSGTTLRLLTGIASLIDGTTTLTGDASLCKRPMDPLLVALNALGARSRSLGGDGRPPVEVRGVLRGGTATLPGDISSQFLSSILIACPRAFGESRVIVIPPLRSRPYVEVTRHLMHRFGVDVAVNDDTFRIEGDQTYYPADVEVPGDFSSAAFPLVAAAITRGDVTVSGLRFDEPQGDRIILDLLQSFGALVDAAADRVRVRGERLVAQTVDVGDTPDIFPVLAVLATQAEGETRFVNGSHLRLKESDRIAATVSMLRALGGSAEASPEGCCVRGPTRLHGGLVDSHGDHRILMAAAVAGLVSTDPVDISDPWCFRVSYPSFLDDFCALGARHTVVA